MNVYNKNQIRVKKNHYLARWALMKHNKKNSTKLLLPPDLFVIKNIVNGSTLFVDCLGEIYHDILFNFDLLPGTNKYNNIVLINNLDFKYKDTVEITNIIKKLSTKHLAANGRIIFSVEHRYLIYDRIFITVHNLINDFIQNFKGYDCISCLDLLGKSSPGYGDYFFCLQAND